MAIEDVRPGVRNRPADRDAVRPFAGCAGEQGRGDRRLGGTVGVVKMDTGQSREHLLDQFRRQRLATTDDLAQIAAQLEPRFFEQHSQQRRHHIERRDALLGDQLHEIGGIELAVRWRDDESSAGQQGRKDLTAATSKLNEYFSSVQSARVSGNARCIHSM